MRPPFWRVEITYEQKDGKPGCHVVRILVSAPTLASAVRKAWRHLRQQRKGIRKVIVRSAREEYLSYVIE